MTFRVLWTGEAENRLAALWTASRFRSRLVDAARRLDERLARNPMQEGESRSGDLRITFEPPLGCDFLVDPARKIVWVIGIWPTSEV